MNERDYQEKVGTHLITTKELLNRLPEGVAKVVLRRGIPTSGTGHYSVKNEYRRVAVERNLPPLDKVKIY